jgi:hypothetical protein
MITIIMIIIIIMIMIMMMMRSGGCRCRLMIGRINGPKIILYVGDCSFLAHLGQEGQCQMCNPRLDQRCCDPCPRLGVRRLANEPGQGQDHPTLINHNRHLIASHEHQTSLHQRKLERMTIVTGPPRPKHQSGNPLMMISDSGPTQSSRCHHPGNGTPLIEQSSFPHTGDNIMPPFPLQRSRNGPIMPAGYMRFAKLIFHNPRDFLPPRIIMAKINNPAITLNQAIDIMPVIAPIFRMMHRKTWLPGEIEFRLVKLQITLILGLGPRAAWTHAQMQDWPSRAPMLASRNDLTKLRSKLISDNAPRRQLDDIIIVSQFREV